MNWYAKKSGGGQGLVIEEATGRNVAVAYDEKDTELLAAAPELLEALNDFYVWLQSPSVDSATLAFMQEKASRAIARAATGEG